MAQIARATRATMLNAIFNAGTLLLGIALIMLGNGLQGTLLGVRAADAGFASTTTGVVMAAYYVGFLAGAAIVPRLVRRVGHIRVFTALASLASATVLLHYVLFDPLAWGVFRLLTGLSYAGLYIVAESWINDRASNETRGALLGFYMLVSLGGLGAGQLLLNLGDPRGPELFILVSVLMSVALVPIALTATRAPPFESPRAAGFATVYRASPLGVLGCLMVGMTYGALFGMGPVYASLKGLSLAQVSWFMAIVLLGGITAQWPLGRLSDVVNRRTVILVVSVLAAACSIAAGAAGQASHDVLLVIMFAYGALALPLYSICVAYTNDYLAVDQMIGASSTIVFVRGAGAIAGPLLAGVAMARLGADGFLWFLAAAHGALGVFALWRMTRRAPLPVASQHHYPAMDAGAQSLATSAALREGREGREAA